jgi:Natural resistance-associated macrophage protein
VIPNLPSDKHTILVATATLGTTLAPWGLAFIQSYTADKQLKPKDWHLARLDIVTGAILTGVIGLFVVIACAETLHQTHRHIKTAKDAAVALAPLAGHLASTLFAIGLVGAGMLAAAILPLATAYSVAESFGHTGKLDGKLKTEPIGGPCAAGLPVAQDENVEITPVQQPAAVPRRELSLSVGTTTHTAARLDCRSTIRLSGPTDQRLGSHPLQGCPVTRRTWLRVPGAATTQRLHARGRAGRLDQLVRQDVVCS